MTCRIISGLLFACSRITVSCKGTYCLTLQEDLTSLGQWEAHRQMKFNVAKCHSVRVTGLQLHKHFQTCFNHLRDNSTLTSLQSGFIPGDSTVNQLTYFHNAFSQALDFGKEVPVVFCCLLWYKQGFRSCLA